MWFAAEGRRGWAWFYGTAFPVVLAALTAVGFVAIRDRSAFAVAILGTPWIVQLRSTEFTVCEEQLKSWLCLSRKRAITAQPSTRR
jgi:hypothetical protein